MKLKPCPFCGKDYWIKIGIANNPDSFWDDAIRGEEYSYIICENCGVVMKADKDDVCELIEKWNGRAEKENKNDTEGQSNTTYDL